MGLLDADIPQLMTTASSFADQGTQMRSTIAQAESGAMQAAAFHQGESSVAFQGAHARFVEAGQKINMLLDVAGQNIHEGGTTYQSHDGMAASDISTAAGSLPL